MGKPGNFDSAEIAIAMLDAEDLEVTFRNIADGYILPGSLNAETAMEIRGKVEFIMQYLGL